MVWIIGLVTIGALICVLAVMMAAESDSERRRRIGATMGEDMGASETSRRRAA